MRRTIVGIGLLVVCLLAFSGGVVAQDGPPTRDEEVGACGRQMDE